MDTLLGYFILCFGGIYTVLSIVSPELIIRISEYWYGVNGLKIDRDHPNWSPSIIRSTGFVLVGFISMMLVCYYIVERASH